MGSEKDLTAEQKGAIVYGYLKNDSYRTIAANVGCGKSVVGNVIRKFCESGTVKSQAVRTGRPPLLAASDRYVLKTLVTSENHRLNLAQVTTTLAAQTKRNVSKKTVRRALHKEGLWSRIARPKPLISTINAEKRLAWCLAHKDWTARHFRHVLWSDESTFCLFQQSSCRIWREPHEEWDIECVSSTVKHSPSRMYWGCFSWYGTGPLIALNGSATGKSHVEILRRYVLPTLEAYPGNVDRGRPWFQQDNARPHTSKIAKNFLNENKVRVLDWPAQSPDLNPIENLWHEVKNALRRKPNPSNLVDLEYLVQEAWRDISPEYCHRLVDSMPDRVNACIKTGGGPTKY